MQTVIPKACNTLKLDATVGLFHLYQPSEDDNLTLVLDSTISCRFTQA